VAAAGGAPADRGGAPAYRTGAPGERRRFSRFSLLLAGALFGICLTLPRIPFFQRLELNTQDLRLRTRGERPVHPDVVVIEIDSTTIDEYAKFRKITWPFPRDQYALLIAALDGWGAKAVGIDLWFSGRDRYSDQNDSTLASVTGPSPSVIHALYLPLAFPTGPPAGAGGGSPEPDSLLDRLFEPVPRGAQLMESVSGQIDLPNVLLDSLRALGHIALAWGVDNVSRYAPLLVDHRGRAVPALSLLMACRYLDADWRTARIERGGPFRESHLVIDSRRGPLRIPTDVHGRALINFPGDQRSFPRRYRFLDVMQAAAAWIEGQPIPRGLPQVADIKGKAILVCSTAVNMLTADVGPTPFSDNFPLAFAHASVVNSILRGDYQHEVPAGYPVILLAVLALGLGLLMPALAPAVLALVALGCLVLLTAGAWATLVLAGTQVPLVPPLFLVINLSIGILLRGYVVKEAERRAVEQELAVARRVQQDLLPKGPLTAGTVQVSGVNLPCFAVGGDYFDYFALEDGRVAMAIGDVSGKGVPAALLTSKLQAILHSESSRATSVAEVPERANRQLMDSMEGAKKFVTLFYGVLDPATRTLRYSNAGHNPPMLLRADGRLELLEAGGLLIGIFPHARYDEGAVELAAGDVLVLFTDGVTEAEDRRKAQYGEERLEALLRAAGGGSAREIGDRICQEVLKFSKGIHQADDVTVVVVKAEAAEATA
jgi:serine phosphatase RsbU (regulator of sigma subunit)